MALGGTETREQIYTALFNLLNGVLLSTATLPGPDNTTGVPPGPFVTISRRLSTASQIISADMPAMYLVEIGEKYVNPFLGGPPKVTLMAQLYVYTMCDEQSDTPAADVNNLMDAIEACLTPLPGYGTQTLGNLVQHCWIEGRITDTVADVAGRLSISVIELGMLVDH